ncbi:MAG: hypothetical protein IJ489_00480 [Clostridia bacterium]|nr:hypothetical protein [Clostridia bacterium]
MSELLTYQEQFTEMTVRITDGEQFQMRLEKKDGTLFLFFTDEKRKDIGYCMERDGKISMVYEDFVLPLEKEEYLKCKEWFMLFRLSASETIWKIKKESLGGIDVFVCHDGLVTAYIDRTTRLPIKLTMGELEIDILSVK